MGEQPGLIRVSTATDPRHQVEQTLLPPHCSKRTAACRGVGTNCNSLSYGSVNPDGTLHACEDCGGPEPLTLSAAMQRGVYHPQWCGATMGPRFVGFGPRLPILQGHSARGTSRGFVGITQVTQWLPLCEAETESVAASISPSLPNLATETAEEYLHSGSEPGRAGTPPHPGYTQTRAPTTVRCRG